MTPRIDFYGTTDKTLETSLIPALLVGEPFGLWYVRSSTNFTPNMPDRCRWPIYLIGLTWTVPMVRCFLTLLLIPIRHMNGPFNSGMTDAWNQLSHPHSESSRFLNLQYQPTHHTVERSVYTATTFLDLAIRKDQSEVPDRTHEPSMGHSAPHCVGDSAQKIPSCKLGSLRNIIIGRGVSLCTRHFG